MQTIPEILAAAEEILTRAETENRDLDDTEQGDYDALLARAERAGKIEKIRAAAGDPRNIEDGFKGRQIGGTLIESQTGNKTRAWDGLDRAGSVYQLGSDDNLIERAQIAVAEIDGLEPQTRETLSEMLTREKLSDSAKFVLAAGNPAYRSAFDQWLRSPQTCHLGFTPEEGSAFRDMEHQRASMSESNTGAMLPLVLDPTVININAGSALNIRKYCRVRTTASYSYRGVTSQGATAEFKPEGAEASDASPTINQVDVPMYLSDVDIKATFELWADTDLSNQIGDLLADAFLNQENRALVLGAGTTEPFGALTRISSTTGSNVTGTTASTFTTASYVDVFKVRDAVPARHRQSPGAAWVSNIAIQSIVQQIGIASAGTNAFWSPLADGPGGSLLGFPSLEATSMTGTIATGNKILALINWSQYLVVDRLGTTIVMAQVIGANQRQVAANELFAYRRYGADLMNTDAGRVLKVA